MISSIVNQLTSLLDSSIFKVAVSQALETEGILYAFAKAPPVEPCTSVDFSNAHETAQRLMRLSIEISQSKDKIHIAISYHLPKGSIEELEPETLPYLVDDLYRYLVFYILDEEDAVFRVYGTITRGLEGIEMSELLINQLYILEMDELGNEIKMQNILTDIRNFAIEVTINLYSWLIGDDALEDDSESTN
jgi:hypothetical protein